MNNETTPGLMRGVAITHWTIAQNEDKNECVGCPSDGVDNNFAPLTAAAAERVKAMEAVWDELVAIKANYGDECDHMLTRDAIDLKQAINRIFEELERMCPDALAALERPESMSEPYCVWGDDEEAGCDVVAALRGLQKVAEAAADYRAILTNPIVHASIAAALTSKGLEQKAAQVLDATLAALEGRE